MGRPGVRTIMRGIGAPTDSGSLGAFALALLPCPKEYLCPSQGDMLFWNTCPAFFAWPDFADIQRKLGRLRVDSTTKTKQNGRRF